MHKMGSGFGALADGAVGVVSGGTQSQTVISIQYLDLGYTSPIVKASYSAMGL